MQHESTDVIRSVWFVAGAGAGAYAIIRARRVAEAFTVDGITDRLHATGLGLRMFRDEVAEGKAEAETELRERMGLVPHGTPELGVGGRHRAVGSTRSTEDTREGST